MNYDKFSGLYTSLKRIKEANKDSEIIVTIRKQSDLIVSGFKYHVISSGESSTSLEEFIKSPRGISYLNMCDYEQIYRIINQFFKKDKIYFIMFEDLKSNYLNFYRKFYNILGLELPSDLSNVKENASNKDSEVLFIAKSNQHKILKNKFFLSKIENRIHRSLIKSVKPFLKDEEIKWGNSLLFKHLEEKFKETTINLWN